MERLLAVSIKSEAIQPNLAQIAMKSINPADTKVILGIKRMSLPGELSEDGVLLG